MTKFFALFSVLFTLLLTGCSSAPSDFATSGVGVVTGTITYKERISLPSNALVTVTLEDISLADAPSKVIAKHRFELNGSQVPLEFDLAYHNNKLKPQHTYNVRARIDVSGQLKFISDTIYPVLTDRERTSHVDLQLVSASN